ncbi:MAG TPA: hypothetical protein VG055_00950 [Planctomycetaceae bacterium]|jgi:hypothetical protein|nr:hypothetical protein [Planctomycetaceae bacterium]
MKAFHFLRIAAVLTLLYCAGHTSGMPWTPYTDAEAASVLDTMKSHSFAEQGFQGTYWDLYMGFGLVISLYLLLQGMVLWQLGSLAKTEARRVRPIVVSFLLAFVINVALSWKYFFVVPVVLAGLTAICLAIALVLTARPQAAQLLSPQTGGVRQ